MSWLGLERGWGGVAQVARAGGEAESHTSRTIGAGFGARTHGQIDGWKERIASLTDLRDVRQVRCPGFAD